MADLDLRVDYQDDILDSSVNTKRKYNIIENEDGTKSLEDVSVYTQNGDSFGAVDINKTNQAVLDLNQSLSVGYDATNTSLVDTTSSTPFITPTSGVIKCDNQTGSTVSIAVGILGGFYVPNGTTIIVPVFKGMEVYLNSGNTTSLTFNFRAHTFDN